MEGFFPRASIFVIRNSGRCLWSIIPASTIEALRVLIEAMKTITFALLSSYILCVFCFTKQLSMRLDGSNRITTNADSVKSGIMGRIALVGILTSALPISSNAKVFFDTDVRSIQTVLKNKLAHHLPFPGVWRQRAQNRHCEQNQTKIEESYPSRSTIGTTTLQVGHQRRSRIHGSNRRRWIGWVHSIRDGPTWKQGNYVWEFGKCLIWRFIFAFALAHNKHVAW